MTRTFGSLDKRPRKRRSDIGKKRKRYAGKPVRGKKKRRFPKVIGQKEFLKLFIIKREPMTYDGYKRINKRSRLHLRKEVMGSQRLRVDVHKSEIDTKAKFEDFVARTMWEGLWDVRMFCHAKNRFHVSPKTVCLISVKNTDKGMKGRMIENRRLRYYSWFYKD